MSARMGESSSPVPSTFADWAFSAIRRCTTLACALFMSTKRTALLGLSWILSLGSRHDFHYIGWRRRTDAELRQCFIQLLRELYHVFHGAGRLARSLRGLARDAADDLHRLGHPFGAAHLLLGGQGNLLHQLCRLPHHNRNGFQRPARLVGQPPSYF